MKQFFRCNLCTEASNSACGSVFPLPPKLARVHIPSPSRYSTTKNPAAERASIVVEHPTKQPVANAPSERIARWPCLVRHPHLVALPCGSETGGQYNRGDWSEDSRGGRKPSSANRLSRRGTACTVGSKGQTARVKDSL
jgi:hypothetical protein